MNYTETKILKRIESAADMGLLLGLALTAATLGVSAAGVTSRFVVAFMSGLALGILFAAFVCGYGIRTARLKRSKWRLEMHRHSEWLLDFWQQGYAASSDAENRVKDLFAREDAYTDGWHADAETLAGDLRGRLDTDET